MFKKLIYIVLRPFDALGIRFLLYGVVAILFRDKWFRDTVEKREDP